MIPKCLRQNVINAAFLLTYSLIPDCLPRPPTMARLLFGSEWNEDDTISNHGHTTGSIISLPNNLYSKPCCIIGGIFEGDIKTGSGHLIWINHRTIQALVWNKFAQSNRELIFKDNFQKDHSMKYTKVFWRLELYRLEHIWLYTGWLCKKEEKVWLFSSACFWYYWFQFKPTLKRQIWYL